MRQIYCTSVAPDDAVLQESVDFSLVAVYLDDDRSLGARWEFALVAQDERVGADLGDPELALAYLQVQIDIG